MADAPGLRAVLVPAAVAALTATLAAQNLDPAVRVLAGGDRFVAFDAMVDDLARADVVFVGEQHNDAQTHKVELAILQAVGRRRGNVVVAMEMFERDVQEPIDHFLLDHMTEEEFLAQVRPWPEYRRDYKPLVDFAIAKRWPVIAANLPQVLAAAVSAGGLEALAGRPAAERAWYASEVSCPIGDNYHRRFIAAMSAGHAEGAVGTMSAAGADRYYQAQCLKDETMAESIAQAYAASAIGGERPLVIAIVGAFHSDYGDGSVARTRRRMPDRRVLVASIVPVADPARASSSADAAKRAEYVIYSGR
jgi:uncharacterized iron-regulated protein